ncbi:pyruvate dehydrogenase [Kocuria palustris]|jgi:pyruvate dehydrogenase (quinone)|uniref:pyruvate dehydrogenase n=1 Tax=Kocuria TaxID=57493 RepID=UPI00045E7887|nr:MULTISPECIES: pyruvate dehydrogenase [Kocuria]ALB03642.1 pyruvate dehydrogenase [Kocuria palustris]MBN6752751.1 pyruvate dehydrogenase [Kocuria palustris]MBN6757706.1 pyruvate dehydrogenase [Kocuria palustris]MBN6762734.1 pyruvate dehydrogenase [Kocuria palustris]MBN6782216.1 pyruvate dehydrogenase [Kocuria palustris]
MKLADQIVAQLQQAGVRRIYGIVGDSLNPVVDAVRRTGGAAQGGIDWIHVRHEEGAAMAAAADAQLTGELAVCAGSCGPGNLHLINGLYDAQRTGAPVLAIASHIPSAQIGQSFFQETHPDRLFNECSVYSEMISTTDQSPRVVRSAIQKATTLHGVSVVTLPGDVADLEATAETPQWKPVMGASVVPDTDCLVELAGVLNKADNVALFVGDGVRDAHDAVIELADVLGAPIGHSLRGKDAIQFDNPFDVGMTGLLGYGAAAEGMKDADVMVMLGTDFPYDQFLPDTLTIQVDRDASVLGRRTQVDYPVHGDTLATVQGLLPLLKRKRSRSFLKKTLKRHDRIMNHAVGAYTRNVKRLSPIHPEYVASVLDEVAAQDAVFTADTGMTNVWQARYIRPLGTRRIIGSFKHGTMANALPHAIGAQFAYPDRQVISMSGDGGLSMLLGELVTAATYRLPLTVVLFNNSTLGMVKLEQLVDGLPDFGVDVPDTDYSQVAAAMGFQSRRVIKSKEVEPALREALAHQGPSLVEVITDPNALSMPPQISSDQVFGFATAISKVVMNGGAGEAVSMARSNLRNINALR